MNPIAFSVMVVFVVGWAALALGLASYGGPVAVLCLICGTVAAYLYVPWVRLRAGGYDPPSWPKRFWTNAAFFTICAATSVTLAYFLYKVMSSRG